MEKGAGVSWEWDVDERTEYESDEALNGLQRIRLRVLHIFFVFYLCFRTQDGSMAYTYYLLCVLCSIRSFVLWHFRNFSLLFLFVFALYGVRTTLLFDIPCKYWNWLNTLQNDKRTNKKKKETRNQHQQWHQQHKNVTLQTHILQTNKIIPLAKGGRLTFAQKQILWGEKCWTVVFKEEIMLQKSFSCPFPMLLQPSLVFLHTHFCRRVKQRKKLFPATHAIGLICFFFVLFPFWFVKI